MRKIERTTRFKRDFKNVSKQSYFDKELFEEIVLQLAQDIPLDEKYRDHGLSGDYAGARECHIKPDWLLIYLIEDDILTLTLTSTGTHADLFDM